jgi:CDP-diacylglycerol---serine O-phosphatidyltransferase
MDRYPSPLSCLHPSNALTYVSLLAAVAAIGGAVLGSAHAAGALIGIAVVADTFDGRFARLFDRDRMMSDFGAQLDSLSDAIAFGIAPPVCAAVLALPPTPEITVAVIVWLLAAFVFAACAITRLGFYNLSPHGDSGFIGVPVPVAALIWATILVFRPPAPAAAVAFMAIGAAMISPLSIPRPAGARLALFIAWPVVVIAIHAARMWPD